VLTTGANPKRAIESRARLSFRGAIYYSRMGWAASGLAMSDWI
jgi:hypothetical protein